MTATSTPSAVTRRRGEELNEAICQAIRDELQQHGYAGLTFEGVARRAETSKPVIYRRYDSRADMALDAWIRFTPSDPPPASTGSLRDDLRRLARTVRERFTRVGVDTLRGILADMPPSALPRFTETTTSWAHTNMAAIIAAAQARGELDASTLPAHVRDLPITLVRNELFFGSGAEGGVPDEATLDEIIDDVCVPLLLHRRQ